MSENKESGSWLHNLLVRLGLASAENGRGTDNIVTPAVVKDVSDAVNTLPPDDAAAYQDILASLRAAARNMEGASAYDTDASSIVADGTVDTALSRSAAPREVGSVATSRVIPPSRAGQLLNLPDPAGRARFQVTDRVWPTNVGEASICLWKADKLAAFSLSVDDNHVQDHPFWTQICNEFGFKLTWFLITNKVGWVHETWQHWQPIINAGHDIQSHGFSHLCDAMFYLQREYRQAIDNINDNLSGANVLTHSYAFGLKTNKTGSPCDCIKTTNDRVEAAKYFLAARDVVGAISSIAKVDFMAVPSVSNMRNFFNSETPWAYFDTVLDKNNRNNYRAWYCGHMHHLPDQSYKDHVRKVFTHLRSKQNDVWVGTFTQIAKYAQQYATANIASISVQPTQIRFEVKDEMYDDWFDEPLTVKVRLDQSWGMRVRATQNGKAITAVEVFLHGGEPYALIDVVPDQGLVVLNKG